MQTATHSIPDADYQTAGATIADAKTCVKDANIILKVRTPENEELVLLPEGAIAGGHARSLCRASYRFAAYNDKKLSAFSLELLPRIARAQAMDVLSSQSNLAGYRAVIEAVVRRLVKSCR